MIFDISTLEGSFSSVWTATIARVGAFFAFFELYKICIPSHRSKFRNFAKVCQTFFSIFCKMFGKSFVEILCSELFERGENFVDLEKC